MDGELSIHMTSLQIHSESFRELLAEFLGTFVLAVSRPSKKRTIREKECNSQKY